MRKKTGKLVISVLLIVWVLIHSACSEKKEFRVLVIHSYDQYCASYPDFDKMIAEEFSHQGVKANIQTFYLDCEAYMDAPERLRMSRALDSLRTWHPDIILVHEDQATYSLLKCDNPFVKEVPIIFSGVNHPNWKLIKQFPNVTGFYDKLDFKANIQMMQHFYGQEISFAAILDSTYLDRQVKVEAHEQLKDLKIILFQENLPLGEFNELRGKGYLLFDAIRTRGVNENILLWKLTRFPNTRCLIQLKRDFTSYNIGNLTNSPCFTAINEGFGYGEKLLGGYITSLPIQVKEEVEAAVRILLRGEKPIDMPISESRKEHVLDWDVMQLRGISKDRVPADYNIIHMPFRERYWALWVSLVVLAVSIGATLFGLLIFLYRREEKRKRGALADLAEEKESLSLAIAGSDTYVWKVKEELFCFEYAFWNAIGRSACELSLEELLLFIHPMQRAEFEQDWKTRSKQGKHIVQLMLTFNDKEYQWWEFRYSTVLSDTEEARTTGLLLNIQSFKEREQELVEARKLAEKAELKQSFLANMSHEIRTPLNSIVGFSNILASDMELEEEDKREYIETINRNSDLLLKLVNDILELSRIESGYMSFTLEECIAANVVNELFSTHQLLIPSRLQFLKENSSHQVMMHVDKGRLTQVITNFLNNAVKFTQEGYIKVGYTWDDAKNEICLFVEDSGKGIAKEEQQMIFSRFYKQDEFAQGTGLGLSICQIIIGKLGGRIELWSEPGKGSRFSILLPGTLIS